MFFGLLAISNAFPKADTIELFEPPTIDNETDRGLSSWFKNKFSSTETNIPSKVHLSFYAPGRNNPLTFHVNEDPVKVAKTLKNYGFDPMRQTKLISHGWTSNGQSFCPQFIDGK